MREERRKPVKQQRRHDSERHQRVEKAQARRRRRKKESKSQRLITNILLALCIIVFLVSAIKLGLIVNEYRVGNAKNTAIKDLAITVLEEPKEEAQEGEIVSDEFDYTKYVIDFEYLLGENEDVTGWLLFEEPKKISYPILQGNSNDEYLKTSMDGEYSTMGSIFMDVANSGTYRDDNTIIYGHNMKDNSMFGDLSEYQNQEFYDQYPYFYIYTANGEAMKYEIVAVSIIDAKDTYYKTSYSDDETYEDYINMVSSLSQVDTKRKATIADSMVTLSTCTSSDDKRLVVQGICVETVEMSSRN